MRYHIRYRIRYYEFYFRNAISYIKLHLRHSIHPTYMKILPMDIRFILGCNLEWEALVEADPVASGGPAASLQSAPAPVNDDAARQDRSRSASPPTDPNDFKTWSITEIETIPLDSIVLSPDIQLPSNRAYHAAAILFFLHPELPDKFPQTKDALHAGWMACFKHPMPVNFEELRRPQCVGASAYTDEEQKWCSATLQYLVTRRQVGAQNPRKRSHASDPESLPTPEAAAPPPGLSPPPTPGPVCPLPEAAAAAAAPEATKEPATRMRLQPARALAGLDARPGRTPLAKT
jgi:hypothetical protein